MNLAPRVFALILSSTFVLLAGCGSSSSSSNFASSSTPSGQLASGGATKIYTAHTNFSAIGPPNSILQFNANSNGDVSPTATLSPPPTMSVTSLATDSSGQIYVGGSVGGQPEILVYSAGIFGSAGPVRTIIYNAIVAFAMTIDSSGQLYVAGVGPSLPSVAVFSATANGVSAPTRLIQGSLTQLFSPVHMAVDSSGNVYVADVALSSGSTGQIDIFGAGANGNVAPVRTISNPALFKGIAVDAAGNIYTAEDALTSTSGAISTTGQIVEFANGASGAATPIKVISGTSTGITYGGALQLDSVGNIYLVNATFSGVTPSFNILGFGPNSQGNVAPGINFSSSSSSIASYSVALR